MGVALRAPRNDRAACVSFGSLGFSKVFGRIFKRVSLRSIVVTQNSIDIVAAIIGWFSKL